ncbi:uncharacterized protein LOC110115307 [Dendrobium catenatum]|uniref:Large ribosomal subunit protein uL22c n=1 Tax=Dendrobium catenatum TaxID=906689 RepID=A0A2I0WW35_9ASPA|nr:uncharacterized protein LOC110115307 [Dendrobium catenatum]XP_020704159.1 uncharacterized protein LOC110115307 [Dendrobium catenatum]XP_020704160.1 uncharacterized protein LOC110115307 [Dendrobium catenatum]PKU79878.1 50S ribosomal protein L22, chloroplastic [Dendrobium catenatum]
MVVWHRCLRSVIRQVGLKIEQNRCNSVFLHSTFTKPSPLHDQLTHTNKVCDIFSRRIPGPFFQFFQHEGFFSSRNLLADAENMEPVSSPLTPVLGDSGQANNKGLGPKSSTVQAIKKDIRQSPKKVNLVAKLVRGMRVEDALLQLQVLVKRAAKTVYQVIHSARANASHNHGLDPDKLIVAEAFVGKGIYLKRLSYHAKGRSGIMVRPKCRLTVVVRETTPEEEAKIAKLRVMNYKKLTRKEKQLVPHQLIEITPRWSRQRMDEAT